MKCCFTSIETIGLLGTGAQDGHLDFHTAPELSSTSSPGLPISNSPYGLCRRKATFEEEGYSTRQRPTIHP